MRKVDVIITKKGRDFGKPGSRKSVTPAQAKLLVSHKLAEMPPQAAAPEPPSASRGTYKRRDMRAETAAVTPTPPARTVPAKPKTDDGKA